MIKQETLRKSRQIADFSWRPTEEPENSTGFAGTMLRLLGIPVPLLLLLYYLFFWT